MEINGQRPEFVVTTELVEGTDGTGAKMSKSKGNYVGLTATPDDIYGKLMSIPDQLVEPYLKLLTEWTDPEIAQTAKRREDGSAHPMAIKRVLAGELVAALHGPDAAAKARAEFTARFSSRSLTDAHTLPVVTLEQSGDETIGSVVAKELGFAPSISAVRRTAQQNGLRLIHEVDGDQRVQILAEDAVQRPLREVIAEMGYGSAENQLYLKVGRKMARLLSA
ncbi:MAG: hypothetical protein ACRDPT_13030 [Streptomycetales bacterium]